MYKTPNSTLEIDDDDSGLDVFCTPNADLSLMKMKSLNNLYEVALLNGSENLTGNLSRMKSLGQLDESCNTNTNNNHKNNINGDTPIDLVRLKREFEMKRFNDAKIQSMNNLHNNDDGYDDIDGGFNSRRHHSDNGSPPPAKEVNRLSLQTPKRRVGNTKYVGADSQDDNYQLMKIHSMGTITDIVNNNMKACDRVWNGIGSGSRKYDKRYIVPIRLEEKYSETNGNHPSNHNCNNKSDDVFKRPDTKSATMNPLRKEKSSSCIESMKNRSSTIYDRLRYANDLVTNF